MISVTKASKKVGWLMTQKDSGYIEFCFDKTKRGSRRQTLPDYYLPNGIIYFGPAEAMQQLSKNTSYLIPFLMQEDVSIDIDSKEDLQEAAKALNKEINV